MPKESLPTRTDPRFEDLNLPGQYAGWVTLREVDSLSEDCHGRNHTNPQMTGRNHS